MFQRSRVVLAALITLLATLTFAPAAVGAVETRWEFYGDWGVADLTSDRQTRNNIYVYEIENINGTVYVGGAFQKVVHRDAPNRPIDQAFIVAFDAASGDIVSSFRPEIDHPVYAIAEHPTTGAILVGGEFTRVNGVERTSLVALDPDTGETDPTFTGIVKRSGGSRRSIVRGIDVTNSQIFVGGSFGRAKGTGGSYARRNVAKFDVNGRVDPTWDVNVTGGGVWDLVMSTDEQRVIFGGLLGGVNGVSRPGLAMVTADGVGTLTSAFPDWESVGPYCYSPYPGCILVYDLDVQDGKVLVSAAEHFSSLLDDRTGHRIHQWFESNDTQAGLLDGNRVWRTRHGADNTTGMYYAHDINTYDPLVTTVGQASTGAGGFEIEKGENDCVWIGGAIGGMDLARVPGLNKVSTHHVGFMCPAGTNVPESQLNIDNWEAPPGLLVRRLRVEESGWSFGVFSYTPAPDAVKHEVLLDGEFIAEDDDGSFAFAHLEPGTSYSVEVRATNAAGDAYSAQTTFETDRLSGRRLDLAGGVSVSQIQDYAAAYPAGEANDENDRNTSITALRSGAWWEMDLGSTQVISRLELWARVGWASQARDVHVLISDDPFTSDSLATNQAQASLDVFLPGEGKRPAFVELNKAGRYIRLQIPDTNYLSIAEVDVWGEPDQDPEVVPHPDPYVIPNLNVHRFRETAVGYGYGVFAYDPAADAVKHEVYLDGNLVDPNDDDGSFAFSHLEPGTTYEVELRAVDANGIKKSQIRTLATRSLTDGRRLDLDAAVTVSQVDQYASYEAGIANDEDTGNFSHTQQSQGPWWEMDLGSVQDLASLEVWSRNGALQQSRDLHVLVSDQPFTSDDFATNQAHASLDVSLAGNGKRPSTVELNTSGRYIRLQMDANEYLSLAEVDVWGIVDLGGEVVPHPDPYVITNLNVHNFRQTDVGYTFGVFEYELAADAVRHDVYLDGNLVGTDDDGSFAFSQLEASTAHEVELRAIGAGGETKSQTRTLTTRGVHGDRVDNAAGVSVSQSADYSSNYRAGLANDDDEVNTSITAYAAEAWWEMDLGSSQALSKLELWARNGIPSQTRNVHVLVSDEPFTSSSLAVNQAQASLDVFLAGNGQRPAVVDLAGSGRFIRLQISDSNYLSIAEVNVWGTADPGVEVVPHPDPFKIPNLKIRDFVQSDVGYKYGVFTYTSAPDAIRHEVYLDGRFLGNAKGGSFAISLLEPDTSYAVKLVAVDVDANRSEDSLTFATNDVVNGRIDDKPGVSVAQSSDYSGSYLAGKANDDDVDNTSITQSESGAWWQMDLGASRNLSKLELWARRGIPGQTRNVHVLVSDQPFASDSLTDAQAQASVDVFLAGDGLYPATVDLDTSGRYVRLQISDTNYLSIGEVNVWNVANVDGEVVPHPNPLPGGVAPPPPANGDLVCELEVDGNSVDVNWSGTTAADSVIVYRTPDSGNRHWRGKVPAADETFADTLGDVSYSYELLERTGNHFGGSFDCGETGTPPPPPPPAPAGVICEVDAINGEAVVAWTGQLVSADSIIVYRTPDGGNRHWRGRVDATELTFTDSLGPASYAYQVRERTDNVLGEFVDCGTVEIGQPGPVGATLSCSVANLNGDAVITLAGATSADSVIIYRSTGGGQMFWRGKIDASEVSFADSLRPLLFEYEIRERTGVTNSDPVPCGSVQG